MSYSAPPVANGSNVNAASNDFGDFESHQQTASSTTDSKSNKNTKQWGDFGNLVDLSGIAKNESKVTANKTYADTSFNGLDGFSRSQATVSSLSSFLLVL